MAKKDKPSSEKNTVLPAALFDGALAETVKESAQQIWLAGMGAFAKAQAEGGKVFDKLVKEGTALQRKTQAVAEEKITEAAGRIGALAGEAGTRAEQQWDKLESIFEQRVARSLRRLDVPSASEIEALSRRIDALGAQVQALSKALGAAATKKAPAGKARAEAAAPAKTSSPAPPAARKPAAKRGATVRKAQ